MRRTPFFEVFASALNEDYRFPVLEIFAFLYAIGTFVFVGASDAQIGSNTSEYTAYFLVISVSGIALLIFVVLLLKNIAYGLGSDLEKGILQTLLSYPLKRGYIFTTKVLSALGVSLLLFLGIQIFALFLLKPYMFSIYFRTILLTYLAQLSPAVLIAGIVLILALVWKRGGLALIIGVGIYFAFGIISTLVLSFLQADTFTPFVKTFGLIYPSLILGRYYSPSGPLAGAPISSLGIWIPTFSEVLWYIISSYVIVALVISVGYVYFTRRLET